MAYRWFGRLRGAPRKILEAWDAGYRSPSEIVKATGLTRLTVMRWMPLVNELDWVRHLNEIRAELAVIRRELERIRSLIRARLAAPQTETIDIERLRTSIKEAKDEY